MNTRVREKQDCFILSTLTLHVQKLSYDSYDNTLVHTHKICQSTFGVLLTKSNFGYSHNNAWRKEMRAKATLTSTMSTQSKRTRTKGIHPTQKSIRNRHVLLNRNHESKTLTRQRALRPKASTHTNTNCYCIKYSERYSAKRKQATTFPTFPSIQSFLGEINHSIPGSCGSSALVYHQLSFQTQDQHRLSEQNIAIIR